jgi:hypothetical protein
MQNELNESEMSITNMPAIIVPMPPPLVRQMCYLPEHYPPFAPHSEPNCPCGFCVQDRFSQTTKAFQEAIKEVQQIELLGEIEEAEQTLRDAVKEKIRTDLVAMTDKLRSANAILEQEEILLQPEQEEEILLQPEQEEEILLQPVVRSLEGFAIPTLSRSTNDPSTWGPADDEEILLVGI